MATADGEMGLSKVCPPRPPPTIWANGLDVILCKIVQCTAIFRRLETIELEMTFIMRDFF